MKNFVTLIVVIFALAIIPAASYAQMVVGQSQGKIMLISEKDSEGMVKPLEFQASDIVGKGVQNPEGQYLGVVRDLMIDPQGGGVAFAILSHGGVLGIPTKFVAAPFSAFTFNSGKGVYVLDMSREKLDLAPGFDRGQWPQHTDRAWETDVYRYYGETPAWGESDEAMAAGQSQAYRYTEIRGTTVRNLQGEKLGFIRDLVVDSEGHVPEAVISHGGFLGVGAKWVTVSLNDLQFDAAKHSFVLAWTKERLDAAPAFNESKLGGPSWAKRAYQDYGAYPME